MKRFLGVSLAVLLAASPALASSITLTGAGKAGASAPPGTTFVDKITYRTTSAGDAGVPLPATRASGNICIIGYASAGGASGQTLTMNGSGVTLSTISTTNVYPGFRWNVYARVLSPSDASNGTITLASGSTDNNFEIACWNGPTTATSRQTVTIDTLIGTSLPFTGNSPSGGSMGFVALMMGLGGPAPTITNPGGWTARLTATTVSTWYDEIWDEATGYTGPNVAFSTWDISSYHWGDLIEFTP